MRVALAVTALVAAVVSCTSFTAEAPSNSAVDAGAADGASPTLGDAGARLGDAGIDAGTDASSSRVPIGMVPVGAGYAIDATEVTVGAWMTFLQTHQLDGSGITRSAKCVNAVLGPQPGCTLASTISTTPQTCVNWCDAEAFCNAAGKRLCGKINAAVPITGADDAQNSDKDQWVRACAGGANTAVYPYGAAQNLTACNTQEADQNTVVPVGSFTTCHGGLPGLFDMSGNVGEWEDACFVNGDGDHVCLIRGGSWEHPVEQSRCDSILEATTDLIAPDVGVRCCLDL